MRSPVCPNCRNRLTLPELVKELFPFTMTCQHCNHELSLTRRWRWTLFAECVALALFVYFSDGIRSLLRDVTGPLFSPLGLGLALIAVLALLTWQSIRFELQPSPLGKLSE